MAARATLLAWALVLVAIPTLQAQVIERVSVATDGTQGNDDSFDPSISADGRWVVFASLASRNPAN